jgi:hypothetical protein
VVLWLSSTINRMRRVRGNPHTCRLYLYVFYDYAPFHNMISSRTNGLKTGKKRENEAGRCRMGDVGYA